MPRTNNEPVQSPVLNKPVLVKQFHAAFFPAPEYQTPFQILIFKSPCGEYDTPVKSQLQASLWWPNDATLLPGLVTPQTPV